jgi:2-alkyl-3-oxoalkanoate reductase
MKVFVAGATGAVGRPLVSVLIKSGHSVVGLSRTPSKADLIRQMGAEPAIADGLNADAIATQLSSTRPDVVIQERTNLAGAAAFRPHVRR